MSLVLLLLTSPPFVDSDSDATLHFCNVYTDKLTHFVKGLKKRERLGGRAALTGSWCDRWC